MNWNSQGSPWGNNKGDGGRNNSRGNGGPWGNGTGGNGGNGGNRGNNGNTPPDIEELLRKSSEKLRRLWPGNGKQSTPRAVALVAVAAVALWGLNGFYRVNPDEQGVELLFGKYVKSTQPGLNYWFPAPLGEVMTPVVTQARQITIGYRGSDDPAAGQDRPQESMMLTGDSNIIDVDFIVQWRINDASRYLFNIASVEDTVKLAAESAMREVIGQKPLEYVMTEGRGEIATSAHKLLQEIVDSYGSGVTIMDVKLQKADPPREVIDAFNDVQRARQDKERLQNEALTYRNDILPRAKGESERMIQEATGYKEQVARDAEGEAARFISVYDSYRAAKDVTTQRLYLEMMQEVVGKANKVLIDSSNNGNAILPYTSLMPFPPKARETVR